MATEEPIVVAEVLGAAETVVAEENQKPLVKAGEEKPKKATKTSAKNKPRTPSLHPPYFEMIKDAIVTLKEKTGSSQHAITKFIEEKHKNLPANFKKLLLTQLKKFVAASKLVKVKASYKLPATKAPAATAAPAKTKPAAKSNAAAKPNPAAKKALKKKVTTRSKAIPKAKTVAKPKASKAKPAAKPKTAAPKVAKPAAKGKAVKSPTKVGRTSRRLSPGKKSGAVPRKAPVRKGKK